ncbi:hypothetical protein G7054_g2484 [Neopestalotiopsis clavispora]|nr:hypothetical protein G7054_g2484 [Neopestalotiopsis clavispora]
MTSIEGKVIAISGAASGIGLATAQRLAAQGAKLSLTDSSAEGLKSASDGVSGIVGSDNVLYRVADVRDSTSVDAWIRDTVQHWGILNGAVNCAGVHPKESGIKPIWEVTDDDWQFAQDVNVNGMRNCVRAQLKHMVAAAQDGKCASGSVVIFGSKSSITGASKLSAYTTSKHAVIGLTRATAVDAAPYNIRVNAVCPGPTDTPMLRRAVPANQLGTMAASIPLRRLGTTDEVVGLVSFLLGDESIFCTGSIHMVDGGLTTM